MRETVAVIAIVATLGLFPVGGLLALLAFLAFDVPLHSFVTFGERVVAPLGLMLWWLLALIPAAVYALILRHEEFSSSW